MSAPWAVRGMRLLVSAVLICALAACSAVQLSYNNADVLARFMASDYTDFSSEQSARFKERFAVLHGWHRHQELPVYVQLLRATGEKIERGLTVDDVRWAIEAMRNRYHRVAARAVEEGAPLLASLTSEQHAQLDKRFAENNRKGRSISMRARAVLFVRIACLPDRQASTRIVRAPAFRCPGEH